MRRAANRRAPLPPRVSNVPPVTYYASRFSLLSDLNCPTRAGCAGRECARGACRFARAAAAARAAGGGAARAGRGRGRRARTLRGRRALARRRAGARRPQH
jgi:hypothetical protein